MLFRLGIFAAFMLATCGAATAQVKVRIEDLAQSLSEIGSRVIIDQGIDKKYGFAAEYRAYPTLDELFTAIRGKDVDVGFGGWTAIAQFRGKGFPVTMIFPVGRGGDGRRHRAERVADQDHRRSQGQEGGLLRRCGRHRHRAVPRDRLEIPRLRSRQDR